MLIAHFPPPAAQVAGMYRSLGDTHLGEKRQIFALFVATILVS